MLFLILIIIISVVGTKRSGNQTVAQIEEPYSVKGCEKTPFIVLKELFAHYTLVYPQRSGNATNLHNFNKNDLIKKGSCPNRTELTLNQICRMEDKFGSGYYFNLTTKEMVRNPRGRLYWEKNFKGSFHDFNMTKQYGTCQSLNKLDMNVRSVETYGTCIRVFSEWSCWGWSMAIYPGNNKSQEILNTLLTRVRAVGPCFEDEFIFASFEDATKTTIVKNPQFASYIPDLVDVFSWAQYFNYESFFEMRYLVGTKKRVEFLPYSLTTIERSNNPNNAALNLQKNYFYESLDKEEGDVITFAIPLSIGGPKENFNIFPASPDCAERWNKILNNIPLDGSLGNMAMIFVYESNYTTRPLFFYYWIQYEINGSLTSWYGRVLNGNGVKINLRAKLQEIDKIKSKITKKLRVPVQQLNEGFKTWTNDSTDYCSNSTLPSFNTRKENISSEMDCRIFQFLEDIQESPAITNGSIVPKDYINDMVSVLPFAVFYSGQNYTGSVTKYYLQWDLNTQPCYHLPMEIRSSVESVLTFGKCIRLYEDKDCWSKSLAVYPGSGNSHAVLQFGLTQVKRIQACYRRELLNSTFSDARNRQISKNRTSSGYIPDISRRYYGDMRD